MSINRPKRATPRRADSPPSARDGASTPTNKPPKWKDVIGDKPDNAFAEYAPSATFARDALVAHHKFGKGVVLEVDGNKINILFEEGIRKLMHGTPSS